MSDFFAKRNPKKSSKVIHLVEEGSTSSRVDEPPEKFKKKRYSKHTSTNGFNEQNDNERVKRFMSC